MSDEGQLRTVCVAGLGTAVVRERLVGLIQRIAPRVTLISSPGGYGKSMLAGQIAHLTGSARPLWLDGHSCPTALATLDALAAALECEPGVKVVASSDPPHSLADRLELLARLTKSLATESFIIVLDDIAWLERAEGSRALLSLLDALPKPWRLVITTRCDHVSGANWPGVCVLRADDLSLDRSETAAIAELVSGKRLSEACAAEIHRASGGQAALVSVISRAMVLQRSSDVAAVAACRGIDDSVRALADSQLDEAERLTLEMASLLGHGSTADLQVVLDRQVGSDVLRRLAAVVPLVRVTGSAAGLGFVVHELARGALADCASLRAADPHRFQRILEVLFDRGESAILMQRVLELNDESHLAEWLERTWRVLIAQGAYSLLEDCVNAVSPALLVQSPSLLVLRARVAYETGNGLSALDAATTAREVARHSETDISLEATLLHARIQMSRGECAAALEGFGYVAESCQPDSGATQEANCNALAYMLMTMAALGQRADSAEVARDAMCASGMAGVSPECRVRLLTGLAIFHGVFLGDWKRSASHLRSACRIGGAGAEATANARLDYGSTLVLMGRVHSGLAHLSAASRAAQSGGMDSVLGAVAGAHGVAHAAQGEVDAWRGAVARATEGSLENGEFLWVGLDYLAACEGAMSLRLWDEAVLLGEQGASLLDTLDAHALSSQAMLHKSACASQQGEHAPAAASARDVSEWAQTVGALRHHLIADLILSDIDCRNGESDSAIHRLEPHVPYILSESPNLTLANYIRAFPRLLGPVTAAVGADRLPAHMLKLILPEYAEEAVAAATGILPRDELDTLSLRLLGRTARGRRSGDLGGPAVCEVRMFGGFEVKTPEGPVSDRAWTKRRARQLFAMLAVRGGQEVPRDEIMEYLWPDLPPENALNNLYVTWSAMKRALSPGLTRDEQCPYAEHARGVCRLRSDTVRSDLAEFRDLLALAARSRSAGSDSDELDALQRIAEIYRGNLLPGQAYEDWFSSVRERCRHEFEDAMLRAAELYESRGEPGRGLGLVRRALELDPWREDLYQAALRLQIAVGQRSAAIETYLSCRSRLVDDLGIDPSSETTRLYQQVLAMEEPEAS